jgi:hypothetical protein
MVPTHVRALVATALFGVAWLGRPMAAPQTLVRSDTAWLEDLTFFADHLAKGQKDFARVYPQDAFDGALNAIRHDLPHLSNHEVKLRLICLVASAHIVHNAIDIPKGFLRLPMSFYWYSDGLVVTAAAAEYRAAIGARVLRVGSLTPEELERAVAPYVSYENGPWLHEASPTYMRLVDVLHELKVDDPDRRVAVTVQTPSGQPVTLRVPPGTGPETLVTAEEAFHIPPRLALGRNLSPYYWYRYLPESQTLYVQYNKCDDDPQRPFRTFVGEMFSAVDALPIERTIVDLRFNTGGDNAVAFALEDALNARPALRAQGHLYALIGRSTVSSGMDAAADFRKRLHALLIGEPLGERPNTYGEVSTFTLPNSGLVVRYSTKYFRGAKDADPASLEPDVLVTRSIADFLAGRDPVLDAALRHPLR